MSTLVKKIKAGYAELGSKFGAFKLAPSRAQAQTALFVFGIALLSVGIFANAGAQVPEGAEFNDARIANSVNILLTYLEGSFGALVMVTAGIAAILASAFGQYRAALGALVVAVGAFILRSVMATFFNTTTITQD
ncbi:MAG: hypothetical protein KDD42_00310 [Bdellovibrionales bacterium]|nr:hypothetical protein [Bdellovibrionales bacterium]